jgi:hypothetical protein
MFMKYTDSQIESKRLILCQGFVLKGQKITRIFIRTCLVLDTRTDSAVFEYNRNEIYYTAFFLAHMEIQRNIRTLFVLFEHSKTSLLNQL